MNDRIPINGLSRTLLDLMDSPEGLHEIHPLLDRYCHRVRNRLNSLKLSLYLTRKLSGVALESLWPRTELCYQSMERLVEQLQWLTGPLQPVLLETNLRDWLTAQTSTWSALLHASKIGVELTLPDPEVTLKVDTFLVEKGMNMLVRSWGMFGPAGGTIRVSVKQNCQVVTLVLNCEGADPKDWFRRSKEQAETLELPILARILEVHGGHLGFRHGPSFSLSFPTPSRLNGHHEAKLARSSTTEVTNGVLLKDSFERAEVQLNGKRRLKKERIQNLASAPLDRRNVTHYDSINGA